MLGELVTFSPALIEVELRPGERLVLNAREEYNLQRGLDRGELKATTFRRLKLVCEKLGMPVAEGLYRGGDAWDGHCLQLGWDKASPWAPAPLFCHEIGHWIVATPERRHRADFGLIPCGLIPCGDSCREDRDAEVVGQRILYFVTHRVAPAPPPIMATGGVYYNGTTSYGTTSWSTSVYAADTITLDMRLAMTAGGPGFYIGNFTDIDR